MKTKPKARDFTKDEMEKWLGFMEDARAALCSASVVIYYSDHTKPMLGFNRQEAIACALSEAVEAAVALVKRGR